MEDTELWRRRSYDRTCRILQGITPNCGAKMAKFQTWSTPLTTVFSYCIGILYSMKTVLNIGNRNSVFRKAEINFSYGNLTWEKWTKSSHWWLTNSKLLKVTTNISQKKSINYRLKIDQFGAKLGAFQNREKLRKISDFPQIHVIQSFLVIFRDFQMYVTLRQIDGF